NLAVTILHELFARDRGPWSGIERYVGTSVRAQKLTGHCALDTVLLVIEPGAKQPGGIVEEQHVPPFDGYAIASAKRIAASRAVAAVSERPAQLVTRGKAVLTSHAQAVTHTQGTQQPGVVGLSVPIQGDAQFVARTQAPGPLDAQA